MVQVVQVHHLSILQVVLVVLLLRHLQLEQLHLQVVVTVAHIYMLVVLVVQVAVVVNTILGWELVVQETLLQQIQYKVMQVVGVRVLLDRDQVVEVVEQVKLVRTHPVAMHMSL